MFLKNLKLTNFRNFSRVDLDFGQTTLLIGNNAQGKSNLLESIYFLATSKSPRAEKDLQLVKEGEEFVRVGGEVGEKEESTALEIVMRKRENSERMEKRTRVNGVGRQVTDYIGNLIVVHFSPEDINLVNGPPALRRWHLDLTLAQVDRDYKNALNAYHGALSARNRLLKGIKEGLSRLEELDFWTGELVKAGITIAQKRRDFFRFLNSQTTDDFLGEFRFFYQESLISSDRVREYLSREVAAAQSLIGPHRDDFIFKMGNRDLAFFGSRGEQRSATLVLKLSELKFLKEKKQTSPVLLLDDVFSEFDTFHRDQVILAISGQQIILSAVEGDQIPKKFLKSAQVVKVEGGEIIS